MPKLRFTNKAVEDLSSIWNYTFDKWSEKQADTYYSMLIDICNDIADTPHLGRLYDRVSNDTYGILAGRHIIFYRLHPDNFVEIIRILHCSMDLKDRFEER